MKPRSLHARMILVLVGVIMLCWGLVLVVVLVHITHNKTSTWDEKLRAIATQLLVTIPAKSHFEQKPDGPGLQLPVSATAEREQLVFQVWANRTQRLARTPGAPDTPLRPDFVEGAASTVIAGQKWRVYSISDSTGRVTVQVGNLHSVVDAELRHEAMHALVLATVLLLVAGALMWLVVRGALKPVRVLGDAVRGRRSFDLTPLPLEPLPLELHPLVASFNHVLQQLDEAIEGERRFIGDAAHELRTPLSALQAQAEIALRAEQPQDKDEALRKLLRVAQRSTRLSEQLLDLARLNAGANAPRHEQADLSDLVLHVAQEFEVQAQQSQRTLTLDAQTCRIQCNVDEIGILLRNLIDNALRYTAPGGTVLVRCGPQVAPATDAGPVFLEVADDGPGVPAAEHTAIFTRFHRVAGTPTRGSGIGLSLVAGIAQAHGAAIETSVGLQGRGLRVRVTFPGAADASPPPA
ncbi:MAG: Sensor protein QseC [Paracidovorax wautersii]|uniref:histidine kinase n=1 Tax=Paracidovorax wautersii TaxID=1177982 RepID=A0A7V8FKS5_9BURK|nr:MAG: Sensor protein QseC [Paracidovorax wautersii]